MQTEPSKADPPKRKRRWFQFSLRSLLAIMLICAGTGCQPDMKSTKDGSVTAYEEVHKDGLKVINEAREIQEIFGAKNVDHFITHFGFPGEKTNSWTTNVWFGGHYELGMEVEVVVDYANHRIERVVGKPRFFFSVVQRVDILPDGRAVISYDERQARQFGPDEWATFYKNNGDFSKIGITIVSDAPIPGFDEAVRQTRRDRIRID